MAGLPPLASPVLEALFTAARTGDVSALRALLAADPGLVHARDAAGLTPLHAAIAHPPAIALLLSHGADPDARDAGDNAYALHFAAAAGQLDTARALLDAGGDVHGTGDVHGRDVIGWATDGLHVDRAMVALLVSRGARHHIFSAIAMADPVLVQTLVASDPAALLRRRSRFEQGQTCLHYAIVPADGLAARAIVPQYDVLDLLLDLGADPEATDDRGRTPLVAAMLRGDREAMRRLVAAGARIPASPPASSPASSLAASVRAPITPMLRVTDMAATLAWYTAIGFTIAASHGHDGIIDWARLTFGAASLTVSPGGHSSALPISLWFTTDRVDDLYRSLRARQLQWAESTIAGQPAPHPEIRFIDDLHDAFYGQREFTVRDPDGFDLVFAQPIAT